VSLPLAILGIVVILVGFVLYLVVAARLYKRLRRAVQQRGYKSPVVLNGAAVAAFTLPFVFTLVLVRIVGKNDDALWWILAFFLAVPLALTFATRLLPVRNPRTAGRRVVRFPYRPVGYVLLGAALAIWTAAGITNKPGLFQLGIQFALGGLGCLGIARRFAAPDASLVLAQDPRPPVLYLRPFQHEEEPFAELPWRWQNFWANVQNIIHHGSWRLLTLEQYLATEISIRIGPFVALGNPIDFVPPEGAARTYVADEEWTKYFEEMVRRARCTVMMAISSEHVLWELAQIRALGLEQKLFVLTKPRLKRKTRTIDWFPFATALRHAGYEPSDEDPGPGAVIAFEGRGHALVLERDTKSAAETVDALCGRMGILPERSKKVGLRL
jgi:hypothetical protein